MHRRSRALSTKLDVGSEHACADERNVGVSTRVAASRQVPVVGEDEPASVWGESDPRVEPAIGLGGCLGVVIRARPIRVSGLVDP